MPDSVKDVLSAAGVLQHVVLPPEIGLILAGLEVAPGAETVGDITTGQVNLKTDLSKSPIPGFDFALALPPVVKPAPFKLKLSPTAFQFWLLLADQGQATFIFKFARGVPGLALTGAALTIAADGSQSLDPLPAGDPNSAPHLVSRGGEVGDALGPALLISGSDGAPANLRFTPDTDSTRGVVALGLEPRTVVFGGSKIGFDCPAVIIDDSEDDKGPGDGAPALDPPLATIDADTPAWRGLLAREIDFYLPASVPLFGGHPIKGYFAIPFGHGGVELVVQTKVPARPAAGDVPGRPGWSIRIECIDPTASGLSGLLPTLISASMELPLDGAADHFAGGGDQTVTFAAGKPVTVTATFARDPVNAPDKIKLAIGVAAQGQEGLVSVTSNGFGGAKIFNTAAALATALIADKDIERKAKVGDGTGVVLYGLLAAGTALSSLFTDDSHFVLHGAEIESSGHGAPVGGPIVLTLDYSVAVRVTEISVGILSVSMSPDQPMRIRVRKARMSLDPAKSGLSMVGLDFDRAEMEIENPGAWNVEGLESLFDVLGSRSGRGSSWIEVDLQFKLNLGPIKVSGATIRATLNDDGSIAASIRGLEAGLTIPGAVEGSGSLQLIAGGFAASLSASLLPLNVSADAGVIYAPPKIVLRLSVDLPAPIPLANTGFGLIGVGGLVGFSAIPDYGPAADPDPVLRQLKWTPNNPDSFATQRGESTFGLFAAVGTLPDLGFSFSAKAGILISVPDIAIRGSLNGKILQPPVKINDPSFPPSPGISFLGFIGVSSEALDFGVLGLVDLKPLLEIRVPIAGHFPFTGDTSDWYVYLGADGAPTQGRSIGPISSVVLPGILDSGADAYVMLRGKGIDGWPAGRSLPGGPLNISDGFVLAFGFGIQEVFGVKPIVWAELYASLDLLIGAKPPTLAGFGRAGGSLNLGPFSLGVEAQVIFMVREDQQFFWAEVTGRIELFFFDIEGTVTISFGDKPELTLPPPDRHPLDQFDPAGNRAGSLGVVTDDSYRTVSALVEDPALIKDEMQVWPDAMISLPFAIVPAINTATAATQFPAVAGPGALPAPLKLGSEMLHYNWRLDALALVDVTDEADPFGGAGVKPTGQLASRWQAPRSGGGPTDLSELLLFSTSPDLWINRLADAGAGMASKPLEQAANLCQLTANGTRGWAIGYFAGEDRPGYRLPPDPVSANPLQSRVEARMHHFALSLRGLPFGLDGARTLPEPFSLEPPRLVTWPARAEIKHVFEGHVVAPNLHWLDGRAFGEVLQGGFAFAGQEIVLDLTEPILGGQLILVADPKLFADPSQLFVTPTFAQLRVIDDTGVQWVHPEQLAIPTGETAGLYHAPHANAVRSLRVLYPLGAPLGVVGVGGMTLSARDAAVAENKAIADETVRQMQAAAAGPKTTPGPNVPHQRAILDPGRLYRLDIDMVWAGEISKQNESGQVVSVQKVAYRDAGTDVYNPKGGAAATTTRRQLFFRTTPKPVARDTKAYGHAQFNLWLRQQQDVFQPEMLQRYLAGYDPAQSEMFRFCDDPLRAHFLQDHVPALAKAYDFDLQVAVQRVDRAGPAYASPLLMTPDWGFATDREFLGATDKIRYDNAIASVCKTPTPGATASVNPPLEPEAWYDIHVQAKSLKPAFADGKLPGVTFHTSRWRTPADMLAGLGFTVAGQAAPAGVVTGDLAIGAPAAFAPAVIEGDDQAFQNALQALGMDGWPVAEAPRLSRLWMPMDGGWRFAGVILESPEPIHRPGRFDLGGLALQMGAAAAAIRFDIRRRDRAGARLIYLTATPFRVVTRERFVFGRFPFPREPENPFPHFRSITPTLVLTGASKLLGVHADVSGALVIPAAPGFSEDP
ncbi:hypothetical protein [Phenylobacterium sp.]|uniref:hypothetical protein n=1 Tax=Phenylobacterium sp. TaxID=1871053 RepID=UPI0025F81E39|nr:hypothetical protein [Phenylobacterium sp.]